MRSSAPTIRRLALISVAIAVFATGLTVRQPPTPGRERRGGQYYPTHKTRDGRWRTIMVRTTRPGVTLTTRAGYYAAGT